MKVFVTGSTGLLGNNLQYRAHPMTPAQRLPEARHRSRPAPAPAEARAGQ
jgi:hypothetical protein